MNAVASVVVEDTQVLALYDAQTVAVMMLIVPVNPSAGITTKRLLVLTERRMVRRRRDHRRDAGRSSRCLFAQIVLGRSEGMQLTP